jgi:uncharacterized protein (DUF2252 family)
MPFPKKRALLSKIAVSQGNKVAVSQDGKVVASQNDKVKAAMQSAVAIIVQPPSSSAAFKQQDAARNKSASFCGTRRHAQINHNCFKTLKPTTAVNLLKFKVVTLIRYHTYTPPF